MPRYSSSGTNPELHGPATGSWSLVRRPPVDGPVGQDEVRGLQPASSVEETAQHGVRDRVRRVGDDVEGTPRQAEVGGVGPDDRDAPTEALLEVAGASVVQFDGQDAMPIHDQRSGDCAGAGADVENERGVGQRCVSDEVLSGLLVELVPSPAWLWTSHGGGPS